LVYELLGAKGHFRVSGRLRGGGGFRGESRWAGRGKDEWRDNGLWLPGVLDWYGGGKGGRKKLKEREKKKGKNQERKKFVSTTKGKQPRRKENTKLEKKQKSLRKGEKKVSQDQSLPLYKKGKQKAVKFLTKTHLTGQKKKKPAREEKSRGKSETYNEWM